MKTYLDCGSGVAGDMLIGALVDLGLSPRELDRVLHKVIPVKGWQLKARSVERQMWPAMSISVEGDRLFGSADRMLRLVSRAPLPAPVKNRAHAILTLLHDAEAHAHETLHPHFDDKGLALLDTLVDVIGNSWGLWKLGIDKVVASPVQVGRLSPAAAWIARKHEIPVYSEPSRFEMATPTGIAILSIITEKFGWMPAMKLKSSGFGAGQKDIPGRPNVLAIYQGENIVPSPQPRQTSGESPVGLATFPASGGRGSSVQWGKDSVVMLETVIDDMDPRLYPHISELLFKAGALDVWWAPVGMKKGRPGIALSVLGRPDDEPKLVSVLFRESTTLGLRRQILERWVLPRKAEGLHKVAWLPDGRRKVQTEFESVRRKAQKDAKPVRKLLKYPS